MRYMAVEGDVKEPGMDIDRAVMEEWGDRAWEDVNDVELPMKAVSEARNEEMNYVKARRSRSSRGPRVSRRPGRHLSARSGWTRASRIG